MPFWNKNMKLNVMSTIAGLFMVLFLPQTGDAKIEQPIAFNHQKHIQNHVTCDVCHPLYKNHARAGIPGVKFCIRCHENVIYHKPEQDKILKYYKSGAEIPWKRVYKIAPSDLINDLLHGILTGLRQYIYGGTDRILFSHRRHVVIGKLKCLKCHGDVANMVKPITKPFMKIEMDNCLVCHRTQKPKVSTDCVDCHR